MRGLSTVRLTGALTAEPQFDTVGRDLKRLRFTIAGEALRVSAGAFKPVTAYTDITFLGDAADSFAEQLGEGSLVDVRGRLDYSRYEVNGEARSSLRVLGWRLTELDPAFQEVQPDSRGQAVLKAALNHVEAYGNLTRDAELRYTPNGDPVVRVAMAINEQYSDRNGQKSERVAFVEVEAWHDLALRFASGEDVALRKGMPVVVDGLLLSDNYTNRDGQKVYRKKLEAQDIAVAASPRSAGAPDALDPADAPF